MKIVLSWLRESCPTDLSAEDLAELLTRKGAEVESVRRPWDGLSGVIVARVIEVMDHPNSTKLCRSRVDTGAGELELVVGVRNMRAGDLVLVKQQATPEPGQVVVATVDGEATLKRYVQGPGYGILKPESTETHHQQVVVRPGFKINGVVEAILKRGAELLSADEA